MERCCPPLGLFWLARNAFVFRDSIFVFKGCGGYYQNKDCLLGLSNYDLKDYSIDIDFKRIEREEVTSMISGWESLCLSLGEWGDCPLPN